MLEAVPDGEDAEPYADAFGELEKRIVRANILERGERPDGRGTTDLRALSAETGLVPRTHGSGLFKRGETQVLSFTTLAGSGMAQRLDDLNPEDSKRFMHHYNFPPFSTGETGRVGNPSRRSIGHGMLGERAMQAILPPFEDFPYTIRVVSEVLSSNGSTSMASVCASVLSMMDAGVPLRTPIAGVAMGLIKGDDDVAILTDIAGLEDHLGDMDFKVAGSREGVTALQMDMKVKGIDLEILSRALDQARDARLEIMDVMTECIAEPRDEMSPHAPRILRIDVPQEKIGQLIGPGGRNIRGLEEETGADISIEDNGVVFITAVNAASGQAAYDRIEGLTRDIEPGQIYTGKVVRILPFGAFVEMVPGKDALVHISELADHHVDRVEDVVNIGDEVTVMVTEIDNLGRVNASCKALLDGPGEGGEGRAPRERAPRPRRRDDDDRGGPSGPRERRPRQRRDDDDDRGGPSGPRERRPRQRRADTEDRGPRAPRERRPRPRFDASDDDRPRAVLPRDEEDVDAQREEAPAAEERDDREERFESAAAPIVQPREDGHRPRRRRRRRRTAGPDGADNQTTRGTAQEDAGGAGERPAEEPEERQPDSHMGNRRAGRGILSRVGIRRDEPGDGPPPPPPPPRSDFGAPRG